MVVDEEKKTITVFGRDITKIPCMRQSILYGTGLSVVGGLLGFLFTSRPRIGSHCAVGTFCGSLFLIFTVCRAKQVRDMYRRDYMQDALAAYAIMESTEHVPVRKPDPILDDV